MAALARSDDVRRQNRALVVGALRRHQKLSRTEIASLTGLSPSTVSAITSDLIGEGVLHQPADGEESGPRRGRPQVQLAPRPNAASLIVVVLSLNLLSAALIDYAGETQAEAQRRLDTLAIGREALLAEMEHIIERLMKMEGRGRVLRIVIAVQGITDSAARIMLWTPIAAHQNMPIAERVEQRFSVPTTVENDCNMIALALKARRPDFASGNFASILLSHGIGMGLVLGGRVFSGGRSSGGEFGHMIHEPGGALCRCGRRGCIEAYAGSYAIWRAARGGSERDAPLADIGVEEMRLLAQRARAHAGPEREAFARAGEAIGYGLGSLFALIDPTPVALVGFGAEAFDLLEQPLRAALARTAGGQSSEPVPIHLDSEDLPLIRQGCAIAGLTHIDVEIFAAGQDRAA